MKKHFFYVLICIFTAGFFIFSTQKVTTASNKNCKIYFADRQLHRLVPTGFQGAKTPEKSAKMIVSQIICGKDTNPEILRLFPNNKDCISVEVLKNTAHVNLSGELAGQMIKSEEHEKLVVYQIVNSLTSVDGIDYVRFTIDGETKKDFIGFLDMREIFTPDYDI